MNYPIRKALAAIAVAAGGLGIAGGSALADTSAPTTPGTAASSATSSTQLAAIQQRAKVAINVRLSALHLAVSDVQDNRFISSSDKSTLLSTLDNDQSGLNALGAKIQSDTTASEALADYRTIFTGYRVFALALPQVRYAAACDDITGTVLPKLTDAQSRLAALLAGPDKSKDSPAVQAAMQDLAAHIQTITSSTNGLSSTVLAITPAQWDANHSILTGPKQTLRTARGDVRTARSDIATVVTEIKS